MELRVLSGPVERAMSSCALLRSRIATANSQPFLRRSLSATTHRRREAGYNDVSVPRWQQTPPLTRMPFRVRPPAKQPAWHVNSSPERLDAMYCKFLGPGGDLLLDEEIKWLAVTHKSFEQGQRGHNDRLAFLGKRIVDMQSSLALLRMPRFRDFDAVEEEQATPLSGLDNLTPYAKQTTLDRRRVSALAKSKGITEVMRWKPRKSDNLVSSGIDTVSAHTVYAIIGAISLTKGAEATNQIVKEKVLAPLGLKN